MNQKFSAWGKTNPGKWACMHALVSKYLLEGRKDTSSSTMVTSEASKELCLYRSCTMSNTEYVSACKEATVSKQLFSPRKTWLKLSPEGHEYRLAFLNIIITDGAARREQQQAKWKSNSPFVHIFSPIRDKLEWRLNLTAAALKLIGALGLLHLYQCF